MLRARLRAACGWSDACILNVSSRGLLINTAGTSTNKGTTIELWHGERVIVATVVWRQGSRAGLQSDSRIPVEEILALGKAPSLQLTAGAWPHIDRRRRPRTDDENRLRGRAIEFAIIGMVAALLSVAAFALVHEALAGPLAEIRRALGR
jgi:hypothetical protein